MLAQFVAYLDHAGANTVTIEHAISWATQPAGAQPRYWSDRMSVARQFARYLKTIDPACEVPPRTLLPCPASRPTPFIYTPEEIQALMAATSELRGELHRVTMNTLIGLMATTGMRVGEAIHLGRDDVDAPNELLRVIDSKFGKSREVALHASTIEALGDYAAVRDRCCPAPVCEAFFLSRKGTRLTPQTVHSTFGRLLRAADVGPRPTGPAPRMHALRHTFAVNTILDWYTTGEENVQAKLPLLSTYLGHLEPATTYYYLTAVPELLALAARRLEPSMSEA